MKREKKRRRDQGRPCPKRGRRYGRAERRAALAWAAGHGLEAAIEKFGVSAPTVRSWQAGLGTREPKGAGATRKETAARGRATTKTRVSTIPEGDTNPLASPTPSVETLPPTAPLARSTILSHSLTL